MNRVQQAFDRTQEKTRELSVAQTADLSQALDMTLDEFARFQELKSLAVASNVLTLEEGQLIYSVMSESLDRFNQQPLYIKVVITQLFKELLGG